MTSTASRDFGALLKRARRAAHLTQAEVAERAGFSVVYVSMLERGVRQPLRTTVALLAEALALSPAERSALEASTPLPRARTIAGLTSLDESLPHALPIGAFLGAVPTGPLVGRESELEVIGAALETAASGQGRLLMLAGEPGVGKTRLTQEIALLARGQDFRVITGRCYEPQQTVAYYPFLEALAMAEAGADATMQMQLGEQWPELGRLLPDQRVDAEPVVAGTTTFRTMRDDRTAQQHLFWQVTEFLRALAHHAPLALLLDDLHWADSASLDLLQHLTRHTRERRILLVGTYRDVEVNRQHPLAGTLADFSRDDVMQRIAVRPLATEETTALIGATLDAPQGAEPGATTVSSPLSQLIYARTEGNAFFARQLTRALQEQGEIQLADGQWRLTANAAPAQRTPETVRSVIGQRLGRLSELTQEVLREASVLGQAFPFDDLAGMSSQPEDALDVALEEARAAGLIRESRWDGYVFPHALIQQTVYDELSPRRRRRLHQAVGEALERLSEPARERRVADLAYHYARSSDHEKAIQYLMRAAERAHAAASYHEEATLLGQAVEAADHLGRSQLVKELRARRGRAFRAVDLLIEAENEFVAALDGLAPEHVEQRIEILIDLGEVCLFLLKVASMRRYASEALKLAEQIGRDDLAAQAMAERAMADASDGEVVTSIGQFQRAFARAGPDHRRSLVVGIAYYGQNLYYLGHYDEAADHIQEVLDFAQSSHDTIYILSALGNLLLTRAAQGRYQDAFQLIEKARRFAREYGSGRWVARAIAMWGGVHLDVGDYAGAEALAEESRELARSVGFPPTVASAGIDLLINYVRRHEVGRAESLVDAVAKATAGAQGIHGWLWRLRLAQARAEIALERGDYEEALRHVDDSLAQSRLRGRVKYQVAGLVTHGQTLVAMGQVRHGIADLRRAVGLARQLGDPAVLLRAAAAMLALDGNDRLLVHARASMETVAAALPDEEMLRCFLASDPARLVERLTT